MSAPTPRPYQLEGEEATFRLWEQGKRSVLWVCPTGGGKSLVFSRVAARFHRETGLRVLLVADRESLVTQGADNVRRFTGLEVGIEMAERTVDRLFPPPVVFATVQSMGRPARLASFDPAAFGLVIFDEADLSVAPSYMAIKDHFAAAKIWGCTATPDRSDGKGLGEMFEAVAGVVEIRDLIEQKYLAPIRQRAIRVEGLDFSKCRTTAGDINEGDLEAVMMEEEHLHGVAHPTLEQAEDRPTVVFGVTVEHSHALAKVFNRYRPGCARAIDGTMDTDERRDIVDPFKAREFQFLINCALMTRGVDIPAISCVALARASKSRALVAQMIGRGTRLSPETGKRDLLVLDFQGNAGKHALVNALDVLDGNKDAEVRERAERLSAADPQLSVLDALDLAARQLADAKRAKVIAQAKYQAVEVDPFTSVETILRIRPRAGRWGGQPATERQLAAIKGAGVDVQGLDRGQASEILDALTRRRTEHLCSYKQAKILSRYGFETDVSFEAAGAAIDVIASLRWPRQLGAEDRARIAGRMGSATPARAAS